MRPSVAVKPLPENVPELIVEDEEDMVKETVPVEVSENVPENIPRNS